MGQGCVGLRTHICCAHGLLPFTFFKQLATPNVLLQHSQSLQGISGHAQRGSQISKPKSLVPFDSMRKGPYLWKESPVPTHYRPKASSEPLSHAWGTAPWESRRLGHCRDLGPLRAEEGQRCSLAGPQLPSNMPGVGWLQALRCMWAWRRPRARLQGAEHSGASGPLHPEPQPLPCHL